MDYKFKPYHLISPSIYLVIAYLCLTNRSFQSPVDIQFIGVDKLVHSALYFVLTAGTLIELVKMKLHTRVGITLFWALFIPVLFGGCIELAQHYLVQGRTGDWFDFAANVSGVIVAYLVFRLISSRLSSK